MAYRRPLTPTQMVVITILWLALVIWIISSGLRLDGLTILMLVCSGVTVFYPIIKSWRERKKKSAQLPKAQPAPVQHK